MSRLLRNLARRLRARSVNGQSCYVCGFGYSPILHLHHIRPLSEKGTSSPRNLIFLCPTCHALVHRAIKVSFFKGIPGSKAHDKHYNEFLEFRNWIEDNLPFPQAGIIMDLRDQLRWEQGYE